MKKIFTITAIALGFATFAQEAADKKVQAGLCIGEGLNINKSGTNLITPGGVGNDFSIGAVVNWHFGDKIGLSTGVIFDIESYKYNVNSSNEGNLYYAYKDKKILQHKDYYTVDSQGTETLDNSAYDGIFRVDTRKQKPKYLTIPTMLTFQTQFYGYLRYFGKAGLRHSFLLSNRTNDTGKDVEFNTAGNLVEVSDGATQQFDMQPSDELSFYKASVGLAGGAEWNFSGTTSLVAELGYYYGFTPIYRGDAVFGNDDKNKSFFQQGADNSLSFRTFDSKQQQILLRVSILF